MLHRLTGLGLNAIADCVEGCRFLITVVITLRLGKKGWGRQLGVSCSSLGERPRRWQQWPRIVTTGRELNH